VLTAKWVGDVCIFTTANRLQYLVGEQIYTISHIDPGYFLLGYIARDGRVYLADKDMNVISYSLSLAVVEYQTHVLRGDIDEADELLATMPAEELPKVARFLEDQGVSANWLSSLPLGYKEKALEVSTDKEQRFELALHLNKLDVASQLAAGITCLINSSDMRIQSRSQMEASWGCGIVFMGPRSGRTSFQSSQGPGIASPLVLVGGFTRRPF
jgi:coatomer subunit beta'